MTSYQEEKVHRSGGLCAHKKRSGGELAQPIAASQRMDSNFVGYLPNVIAGEEIGRRGCNLVFTSLKALHSIRLVVSEHKIKRGADSCIFRASTFQSSAIFISICNTDLPERWVMIAQNPISLRSDDRRYSVDQAE